jgi:hypothetical protein
MSTVAALVTRLRAAVLLSAALGLLASHAARGAECLKWDVSGNWSAIQDNDTRAYFTVTQLDTRVEGDATFTNGWTRNGNFDGTLIGSDLKFTVYWNAHNNNSIGSEIGEYAGTISPTGRVTGTTFDKYHPQSQTPWYSSRLMTCKSWLSEGPGPAGAGAAQPGAAAKPAVTLGRVQPAPGSGNSPPMSICERARAARARGSPTAPALEQQCVASGAK